MTNALALAPSEQHCLGLATLHDYLPVFAHYNAVGHTDNSEAVRDEQRHFAPCKIRDPLKHFVLRSRVQRYGRVHLSNCASWISTGLQLGKSHGWDALDRLHATGYLSDPKSKAKSVVLSPEGVSRARELFERHFGRKSYVCHQGAGRLSPRA